MPLVPSLGSYIPGTPSFDNTTDENQVLPVNDFPGIYTTTGPLPLANGIVVTNNSISFDPSYINYGNFDCGVFGSQGGNYDPSTPCGTGCSGGGGGGQPGPPGPPGPAGATGPQGVPGPTGIQGPVGATGPIGLTGAQGPPGLAGSQGAPGPTGAAGATGAIGPTGPQGQTGTGITFIGTVATVANLPPTATQGDAYIVTADDHLYIFSATNTWDDAGNIQGPAGPTGATGAAGVAGTPGIQGPTGIQGPIGLTGSTGAQGPIGPQGPAGPAGASGATGSQGPTGASGATGPQGVAGSQGSTGPSGPIGPQGPAGINGFSAFQVLNASAPGVITPNFISGDYNYTYTLAANTTIANPINTASGQQGALLLTQGSSTAFSLSWGSSYYFAGGTAYSGNTLLNSQDLIEYTIVSPSVVVITKVTQNIQSGSAPPPPPGNATYTVLSSPDATTNGDLIRLIVNTSSVAAGTTLYWQITGITASLLNPATLTGTLIIGQTGFGNVTFNVASSIPSDTKANWTATFYSDAGFTQQVGNQTGGFINANVTKNALKLGAYIDLYQYRNTGGVWPVGLYPGLNPTMRATNINNILPSLDVFYMFSESQLYSDGKLYFGTNVGNPAALVLNSAGTGWATNTGSVSGGYVDANNPDYTYSAYALKNSMYYLAQQSAWSSNNTFMCIGGYLLSQYMDLAGANPGLAATAGSQIATLMNITGCVGVDLDYEPVGQNCNPANMAVLCQAINSAVKAINATYEVHLTLVPALSTGDSQLRMATAVACYPYVDQVNVMTYDDPNNLYESNYQPGNVPVFSHTGVARSVQSVQWFINAGVPANKLGLGFACYGRNSASESAAFSNTGSVYDQIVRSADAAGQTGNTFSYGTWSGSSPISNPAPSSQSDYYYNPTQAIWAFDSCQTITDKVEASHNQGLRAVFTWQISGDYANEGSPLPPGNSRANFALIQTARTIIDSL